MTRIIAGAASAVRLDVPERGTRPTSDKVREALFSALESWFELEGARVLDLYAGSGALGLEALSRGASSLVLVERSAAAARLARRNADAVTAAIEASGRPRPSVEIRTAPVLRYLESTAGEGSAGDAGLGEAGDGAADLVFSDPPYEVGNDEVTTDLAAVAPLLHPDGVIVVERSTRSGEFVVPPGLAPWRKRIYGETTLHILESAPASSSPPNSGH